MFAAMSGACAPGAADASTVSSDADAVMVADDADAVMRGEILERVYEWPLVVTRDPAVGAPALLPLRGSGRQRDRPSL